MLDSFGCRMQNGWSRTWDKIIIMHHLIAHDMIWWSSDVYTILLFFSQFSYSIPYDRFSLRPPRLRQICRIKLHGELKWKTCQSFLVQKSIKNNFKAPSFFIRQASKLSFVTVLGITAIAANVDLISYLYLHGNRKLARKIHSWRSFFKMHSWLIRRSSRRIHI